MNHLKLFENSSKELIFLTIVSDCFGLDIKIKKLFSSKQDALNFIINTFNDLIDNKEIELENGENFKTADECLHAFKELHEGEFGNGEQVFKLEKIELENGDLILSPSDYKIKKEAKKYNL